MSVVKLKFWQIFLLAVVVFGGFILFKNAVVLTKVAGDLQASLFTLVAQITPTSTSAGFFPIGFKVTGTGLPRQAKSLEFIKVGTQVAQFTAVVIAATGTRIDAIVQRQNRPVGEYRVLIITAEGRRYHITPRVQIVRAVASVNTSVPATLTGFNGGIAITANSLGAEGNNITLRQSVTSRDLGNKPAQINIYSSGSNIALDVVNNINVKSPHLVTVADVAESLNMIKQAKTVSGVQVRINKPLAITALVTSGGSLLAKNIATVSLSNGAGKTLALADMSAITGIGGVGNSLLVKKIVPHNVKKIVKRPVKKLLIVDTSAVVDLNGVASNLMTNIVVPTIPNTPSVKISQSLTIPSKIPNDNKTPFEIRVLVDDQTNINNVATVSVDATPVNGFGQATPILPLPQTTIINQNSAYYTLSGNLIQTTVAPGNYTLPVIITLTNGSIVNAQISIIVIGSLTGGSIAPVISPSSATIIPTLGVVNDGKTTYKINVLVTDADGAIDISSVVADLSNLGGSAIQMDQGEIDGNGYWYSVTGVVIPTVTTGSKTITISASDFSGNAVRLPITYTVLARGTLNADIFPQIENASAIPTAILPNNIDPLTITALVTDPDGPADITSVTVDLSALGLIPAKMIKGAAAGLGFWYSLDQITVPANIPTGDKTIVVVASDKEGHKITKNITINVIAKNTMLSVKHDSYTLPDRLVSDGKSKFRLFGLIRFNQSSGYAISSVTADLDEINHDPVMMTLVPNIGQTTSFSDGQANPRDIVLRDYWYATDDITLPAGVNQGRYQLGITANDTSGASIKYWVDFLVVGSGDLFSSPTIDRATIYSQPKAIINDGIATTDVWAFANDPLGAGSLKSMTLDTSKIGGTINQAMTPQNLDKDGRWYKTTVTVPPNILPNTYDLPITITNNDGGSDTASYALLVADSNTPNAQTKIDSAPHFSLVQAITENKLEAVFDRPMLLEDINRTGGNFEIRLADNVDNTLSVNKATPASNRRIVIINTAQQSSSSKYTMNIITANMRDIYGNTVGKNTSFNFTGFNFDNKILKPQVDNAKITTDHAITINFINAIAMNSIDYDTPLNTFKLQDSENATIDIAAIDILSGTQIRLLTQEKLSQNKRYKLHIFNLNSVSGGKSLDLLVNIIGSQIKSLIKKGDLNADNKINFTDLSIFSKLYRSKNSQAGTIIDFNHDNKINFTDLSIFSKLYRSR